MEQSSLDRKSSKKTAIFKSKYKHRAIKFAQSIWLFPAILTLALIVLTSLQLSGSSIGMYHTFFYGDQRDSDLLFDHPESIRSDEWVVNSQKAIAQKNNDFAPVNQNFGDGEDATLLGEMPYADWSVVFKPQNLGFFVLPFDNAFSLRWWFMPYLLALSCYFFLLALLPNRKRLVVLLSLAFALSPFFHWWFIPSALTTTYYTLFGLVVFMKLYDSQKQTHSLMWSILLAYLATCFILVLYPPFQIPAAIVIVAYCIGYMINRRSIDAGSHIRRNLPLALAAGATALAVSLVFLSQKHAVVTALQDSVYPGHRVVESGGFNIKHFLSSDLSPIFQSKVRSDNYFRPGQTNAINQSESSNFILLFPFLLIPLYYLAYKSYRHKKKVDYILVGLSLALFCFAAWMFIPGLDLFGKITFLDRVPLSRLILGFGLLNVMFIALFIKAYDESKQRFKLSTTLLYSTAILILYTILNVNVSAQFPLFAGYKLTLILAFVFPVIIFLLMARYFTPALILLMLFSLASVYKINPLYRGTEVLTESPISVAIRKTDPQSDKRWISEDIIIENFAAMNGRRSLNGVNVYPQTKLWDELGQTDKRDTYNRYAHVNFTFTRNNGTIPKPQLRAPNADQFNVQISPCDPFFEKNDVGYLITSVEFEPGVNTCAHLYQEVPYPKLTFYIYKITF